MFTNRFFTSSGVLLDNAVFVLRSARPVAEWDVSTSIVDGVPAHTMSSGEFKISVDVEVYASEEAIATLMRPVQTITIEVGLTDEAAQVLVSGSPEEQLAAMTAHIEHVVKGE